MKILESETPGMVKLKCLDCGKYYEVEDFRAKAYERIYRSFYEHNRHCPACTAERRRRELKRRAEARLRELLANLPRLTAESGIPARYALEKPPVRFVAEWIYLHHDRNLLLSGQTGTGKSTSACFVAIELIKQDKRIRYTTLRGLLNEWRKAKTSEWSDAPDVLLYNLCCGLDVLIVDEMVEKARISESGQELLFEMLERVYNGECRARVWLLGNFYTGSLETIFDDAEPVRRRLRETFTCGVIDLPHSRINPIDV